MNKGLISLVVMVLMLAGLVAFSMEVDVEGETLENAGELILLLGVLIVGLILVGLGAFLLWKLGMVSEKWMKVWEKRAERMFDYLEATPVLVSFGQSDVGKRLYGVVEEAHELVDEPDDTVIKLALSGIALVHQALGLEKRDKPLTAEEISSVFSSVTSHLKEMLDGVANKTPNDKAVG